MKRVTVVVRVAASLLLAMPLALHGTWARSQQEQEKDKTVSLMAPKPGRQWQSYISDKYGFQFLYPPGSSVKKENDTGYTYIRVQNYDVGPLQPGLRPYKPVLKPNEFYLEVFIVDPTLGHERWISCAKIDNPKRIQRGKTTVYIGREEHPEGDPGGYREVLCARLKGFEIWVQGTEGTVETPTVKAILNSFQF